MTPNQVVTAIAAVFFVLGALDRCLGCRVGFGREFEKGFGLMGTVALSILGLICIAPVAADILAPVIVPVFRLLGADPAMFSGTILAPDSGGYSIAAELAEDPELAYFGGLIVASAMGGVISFSIPTACGIIEKEDNRFFAVGVLAGFMVDPIGCFVGGLVAGLPPMTVLRNLVPVVIIALLIILGLALVPQKMIRGFQIFSRGLVVVIMVGVMRGGGEQMTGVTIWGGINPITDGFQTVGSVTVTLAGTIPFVWFLTRVAEKPLERLGQLIGVNAVTVSCALVSLSSVVPAFAAYKDMNVRGKVVMGAIAASLSNMLGAHLGFTVATNEAYIIPMFTAKIVAGVLAVAAAGLFTNRLFARELEEERDRQAAPESR